MVKESLLPSIGFRTVPAIKRFKDEWDSLFDGILEEFFRILSPTRLPISPLRQLTYFNALGDNFQSLPGI